MGFYTWLPPDIKRKISSLTNSEYKTLQVIISYYKWKLSRTGDPVKARCFTYDSILRHGSINNFGIRDLTLDRNIRKLREKGIITTHRRGRTVFHCLDSYIAEAVNEEGENEV